MKSVPKQHQCVVMTKYLKYFFPHLLFSQGIDGCVKYRGDAYRWLGGTGVNGFAETQGVRVFLCVKWRHSSAIFRSSRLFWSKEMSVTQESRMCFYNLLYYVSNDLKHLVLPLSLVATHTHIYNMQLKGKARAVPFTDVTHLQFVSCAALNVPSRWFHFIFWNWNCSSGIPLKCIFVQDYRYFSSSIKYITCICFERFIFVNWHNIGRDLLFLCSKVWIWKRFLCLTGKQLSGPLNGLHFPSTLSTAGSNHDGIKITCGRIASSKQQLRDPLHSSWNESLKMHLCHEDCFSLSALIDYELFSWRVGLVASLQQTCSWFFFVVGKKCF